MHYNINIRGHILELNNVEYSPYWNALINSGIGYDLDDEGNILFNDDEYSLREIKCYINHCNNGYIRSEDFNVGLFDYMGHCTIYHEHPDYLRFRLQYQWSIKYSTIPYKGNEYKKSMEFKALIKSLEQYTKEEYIIGIDNKNGIICSSSESKESIVNYTYGKSKKSTQILYTPLDPIEYMTYNKGKYYYKGHIFFPTDMEHYHLLGDYADIYSDTKIVTKTKIIFPNLEYYAKYHVKKLEPFLQEHTVIPSSNVILTEEIYKDYNGINMLSILKLFNILSGRGSRCGAVTIKEANRTAIYLLNALELKFNVTTILDIKYETLEDMLLDFHLKM